MTIAQNFQLVWEEPPEASSPIKGSEWVDRLKPLMDKPGEWARVAEFDRPNYASGLATRLRRRPHWRPEGQWEFRGSTDSKAGTSRMYARYIGPDNGSKKNK